MTKTVQIFLLGSTGRMGSEISSFILNPNLNLSISEKHRFQLHSTYSEGESFPSSLDVVSPAVLIDFSSPEGFRKGISFCSTHRIPFLSGTTGLSSEDFKKLEEASSFVPTFWSPNMSLGIAVLKNVLSCLGPLSSSFDFQIEETHHKYKKDKPSGTALYLQNALKKAVGSDHSEKIPEPLGIRGGGIFGQHRIFALGEEEYLTFEHTAISRRVFARGALQVACWLVDQKPGFYSMDTFVNSLQKLQV